MKERGKAIYISEETHTRLKQHCDEYSFKIQGWVDNIIRQKLDELNK